MKQSLLSLAIAAALASAAPLALADDHGDMEKKGKAKAEEMKGQAKSHKEKAMSKAEKAAEEAEDSAEAAAEAAEEAAEAAEEEAEDAAEAAEEEAEEAAEAAEEAAEDAAEEAEEGEGKPDVPPGMYKRDAHPSTGKGSEQGQESRNAEEKPWWNFWD